MPVKRKKKPQSEVEYTDHGTHKEHCAICTHYIDEHTCAVVQGRIVPGGWCNQFDKAPRNG